MEICACLSLANFRPSPSAAPVHQQREREHRERARARRSLAPRELYKRMSQRVCHLGSQAGPFRSCLGRMSVHGGFVN